MGEAFWLMLRFPCGSEEGTFTEWQGIEGGTCGTRQGEFEATTEGIVKAGAGSGVWVGPRFHGGVQGEIEIRLRKGSIWKTGWHLTMSSQ